MSDELRRACEALTMQINEITRQQWDRYDERDCQRIMAFARAQQAKGLREAAEIANRLGSYDARNVIMLKAAALEAGLQHAVQEGDPMDTEQWMLTTDYTGPNEYGVWSHRDAGSYDHQHDGRIGSLRRRADGQIEQRIA